MTAALSLLVCAVAVAGAAPRVLVRARWVVRAPVLGIVAWCTALLAVIVCVVAAMFCLVGWWPAGGAAACRLWQLCVDASTGRFGVAGELPALVGAVIGVAVLGRLGVGAAAVAGAVRQRRQLRRLAIHGAGAVPQDVGVVPCPEPAAFMVGGWRRQIVVTSGALDVLSGEQLAAVIAHERAHVAGRHDLLLVALRWMELALPRVSLFRTARLQVARLVELRADDVAAAGHDPIHLARALVTVAESAADRVPAGALGMAGGDALERLDRLMAPPARLTWPYRSMLITAIVALGVTPAALALSLWAAPMLNLCTASWSSS